jgi:hypothetical protein
MQQVKQLFVAVAIAAKAVVALVVALAALDHTYREKQSSPGFLKKNLKTTYNYVTLHTRDSK